MSKIKYTPPPGVPIQSEYFSIPASFIQGNNTYILPGTQLLGGGTLAIIPLNVIFSNWTDGTIQQLNFGSSSNFLTEPFDLDGFRVIAPAFYTITGINTIPYDTWSSLDSYFQVNWNGTTSGAGFLNGIFYYTLLPLNKFQT